MIRGLLVLFIIYVVLVISALADCLGGERRPRHLPRFAWALTILLVPVVGAVLWFATGRPRAATGPGPQAAPPSTRTQKAPDDDPEFLAELARRLKKKEEDGGK
ncbi:PLD nuclease N-terminal domain-containing protein [Phytomonospora sp. NPDC050363]|uniref:PLD nuclease N-terminal domain-containing protein n=1 Tax=Phytomonospora sp. NPDC050363 TaxID=3155642 RepID=UPI0033F448BE